MVEHKLVVLSRLQIPWSQNVSCDFLNSMTCKCVLSFSCSTRRRHETEPLLWHKQRWWVTRGQASPSSGSGDISNCFRRSLSLLTPSRWGWRRRRRGRLWRDRWCDQSSSASQSHKGQEGHKLCWINGERLFQKTSAPQVKETEMSSRILKQRGRFRSWYLQETNLSFPRIPSVECDHSFGW